VTITTGCEELYNTSRRIQEWGDFGSAVVGSKSFLDKSFYILQRIVEKHTEDAAYVIKRAKLFHRLIMKH
jgi:hypothetical protein